MPLSGIKKVLKTVELTRTIHHEPNNYQRLIISIFWRCSSRQYLFFMKQKSHDVASTKAWMWETSYKRHFKTTVTLYGTFLHFVVFLYYFNDGFVFPIQNFHMITVNHKEQNLPRSQQIHLQETSIVGRMKWRRMSVIPLFINLNRHVSQEYNLEDLPGFKCFFSFNFLD